MKVIETILVISTCMLYAPAGGQILKPEPASYRRIADEAEANLRNEILGMWFPRAVDENRSAFLEDFDQQWRPTDVVGKSSIVYQSRLTWVASRVAMRSTDLAENFKVYACGHGLDALENLLWDSKYGGFYWQVDANGKPLGSGGAAKHAYGNSFGIYAAAVVSQAFRDPKALALAKKAFGWMENHAHDLAHGGYYEALSEEGKPILTPPSEGARDSIGTIYGLKSMNSHIHLLEALTELYAVWRDPIVRKRLDEVFHVVRDKVYAEPGFLHMFFKPDWTPVPDHDSFGHDIETAYLLVEAAETLGIKDDAKTWQCARRLVDHALKVGWDEKRGGFYEYGSVAGPPNGLDKVWWTEAEGLNALLLMHEKYGKVTDRYWKTFLKQWEWIKTYQVDHKYGGWFSTVKEDGTPVPGSKSDQWKDPYHQGRALMNVIERLRRLR